MGAGTGFVLVLLVVGCIAAVSVVFLANRDRGRGPRAPHDPGPPPESAPQDRTAASDLTPQGRAGAAATPAPVPPPTSSYRPERRRELRRQVAAPVSLRRSRPDAPVERSLAFDLSAGGMQLAGPANLPVGEMVWVALDVPEAGRIDVNARVVHETPQGHKGLRFEEVAPAQLRALQRIVGPPAAS